MATLRELKGRIGSVASSEKITGAMKMISSAKMHKAEGVLRRLQPFRNCVQTVIANLLSSDAAVSSPLAAKRQTIRRAAIIVLGSDDGLCGAYNVNIFKGMLATIASLRDEAVSDPRLTIGEVTVDSKSEGDDVKAFAQGFESRFLAGELDKVVLQYMHFHSAGRQRLVSDVYLPLSQEDLAGDNAKGEGRPYLFEPDAATIFSTVLPMYLLSLMQEAFAENRASEQAARVMAMQSANDNAQKLLEQLQLEYNKLRQQSITTELLDIVGGQARD